jgi:hypothetical protein
MAAVKSSPVCYTARTRTVVKPVIIGITRTLASVVREGGFINMRTLLKLFVTFTTTLAIPVLAGSSDPVMPGRIAPLKIAGVGVVEARLIPSKSMNLQKTGLPFQLDLYFTCEDKRSIPNSVLPEPRQILKRLALCHFYWPPTFDQKMQTMTIYYGLPKFEKDGTSTCDQYKAMDFTLNDTCEVWQR